MGELPRINNMREMREQLEVHALRMNDEDDDDTKHNKKVKTYLIESNIQSPNSSGVLRVINTTEPNLKMLETTDHAGARFYLDITNKRFWQLHTAEPADTAHKIVREYITENNSQLDYCWFYSNFLEEQYKIGKGSGFKVKYANKFSDGGDDTDTNGNKIKKFSMLFWGGQPKVVLGGLRKTPLSKGVSLSAILTNYWIDSKFAKENIQNNGRFTLSKTNSIENHFQIVDKVVGEYSKLLFKIEDQHRIKWKKDGNKVYIDGDYAAIKFANPIEDMEKFISTIFSGTNPFRLFGLTEKINQGYFKTFAVDLHSNTKLDFEIMDDEVRIYLPEGSCGNILLRLLTNLQSYFSSELKFVGEDRNDIA